MAILTDIATALTGSVASNGETPQTGQLRGLVGINPAYSFNGDLNTGFGSDVADEVYAQAGGVKTVRVTATGIQITGTMSMTGAFQGTLTATGTAPNFVGFEAISTDAGATLGPLISVYRNSASPANNDVIGGYDYRGNNSALTKFSYARTYAIANDVTAGTEDAEWRAQIMVGGVFVDRLSANAAGATTTGIHTATSFTAGANPTALPGKAPTYQDLTSGSGATYTTPAGATWLRIRAVGGGGGGSTGTNGGTTTFNGINAAGGGAANGSAGGAGGTGGTGTANVRISGAGGSAGTATSNDGGTGGPGGNSFFGGGGAGTSGGAGRPNTGGGGGGLQGASAGADGQGGGGAGEYFELIIPAPAASYIYTIGAGGTPGGGSGAGGTGRIVVEEHYS